MNTTGGAKPLTSEEQATPKEDRRWLNNIVDDANTTADELIEVTKYTAERWRQLASASEPVLVVAACEKAAKAYLAFITLYKVSLVEASEAVDEGRVKTLSAPLRQSRRKPNDPTSPEGP